MEGESSFGFPGAVSIVKRVSQSLINLVSPTSKDDAEMPELTPIVSTAWCSEVDGVMSDVDDLVTMFYFTCVDAFLALVHEGEIHQQAFLHSMQRTLESVWDARLAKASRVFFDKAQALDCPDGSFSGTFFSASTPAPHQNDTRARAHSDQDHARELEQSFVGAHDELVDEMIVEVGDQIQSSLHDRFGRPSYVFYNIALKLYAESGNVSLSPNDFLQITSKTLGTTGGWCDQLQRPLSELLAAARQTHTPAELRPLPVPLEPTPHARQVQEVLGPVWMGMLIHSLYAFPAYNASPNKLPSSKVPRKKTEEVLAELASEALGMPPIDEEPALPSHHTWMSQVRVMSKTVLSFDVVAYMEEVVNNAKMTADPVYGSMLRQLMCSLLRVKASMESSLSLLQQDKLAPSSLLVLQQPSVKEFQSRMEAVVGHLTLLSQQGNEKVFKELRQISSEAAEFFAYAPFMKMPCLESDHNKAMYKLKELVMSVREVFYYHSAILQHTEKRASQVQAGPAAEKKDEKDVDDVDDEEEDQLVMEMMMAENEDEDSNAEEANEDDKHEEEEGARDDSDDEDGFRIRRMS